MKQVYQVGMESTDSFGTQHFTVAIETPGEPMAVLMEYFFEEGSHVNIDNFISELREGYNNEPNEA